MGRPIPSKAIQHGYHYDNAAYRDNMQVRCSRCGFICNLDRDLRSHPGGYESWGTNIQDVYGEYDYFSRYDDKTLAVYSTYDQAGVPYDMPTKDTYTDVVTTYDNLLNQGAFDTYDNLRISVQDALVVGGCPQCGTYLYNNPARGTKG